MHPLRIVAATIITVMISGHAIAADRYPVKPVRIIVPFAPGGSTDILVRPIGVKLGEMLGQSFLIDNRGGAGGTIGATMAARSAPDGYTLLVTTSGVIVTNRSLYKNPGYDPAADFDPVTIIASLPNLLVVSPKAGITSVSDLIAKARTSPGKFTFASGGNGTSNHLAGELLKYLTKIDITHVAYKGGGPAVIAVRAAEVSMLFATMPSAISHVKAGQLTALAVTSEKRSPATPEVPTMAEAGVKGFEISTNWIGALAPHGTPPGIIQSLSASISRVVEDAEIHKRLAVEGYEVVASGPTDMAKAIQKQSADWARVIKSAGIHAE